MGKNLDTDNIFGSYLNNVLLKEQTYIVGPEKLKKLKQERETETDPVKIEKLDKDIKASEEHAKDLELNPWKKAKKGESSLDHLRRMESERDSRRQAGGDTGQPLSQEEIKNYKSKAVKPEEEVGKATPLTPGERAFADDAKAKGKNWTDSQARLMFAKRNEVETQANAAKTQPATNAPSRGKLTVKSLQNMDELNNATDEEFIQLIKSLQTK